MTTNTFVEKLSSHYYKVFASEDMEMAILGVPGIYRATYRTVPSCFFIDIRFGYDGGKVIRWIVRTLSKL